MGKHRKWFWISCLYDYKTGYSIKRYDIEWDPLYRVNGAIKAARAHFGFPLFADSP